MNTRTERQRRAIAIHAAGHVVAAIRYEIDFDTVTIRPGIDSFGPVLTYPKLAGQDFSPDRYAIDLQRRIVVALSGGVAEEMLTGRSGAERDVRTATAFASTLCGSDEMLASRFLRSLMIWTGRLLQTAPQRLHVEAITAALLDRETLTADQCRLIAQGDQSVPLDRAA